MGLGSGGSTEGSHGRGASTGFAVVAAVFASGMLVQYPHHDRGATEYRPAQPTWPVWLAACSSPGVANVCCVGMPLPPPPPPQWLHRQPKINGADEAVVLRCDTRSQLVLLKPSTLYDASLSFSFCHLPPDEPRGWAWKKIYNTAAHLARFLRSTHACRWLQCSAHAHRSTSCAYTRSPCIRFSSRRI